jgi:hypothetical protein
LQNIWIGSWFCAFPIALAAVMMHAIGAVAIGMLLVRLGRLRVRGAMTNFAGGRVFVMLIGVAGLLLLLLHTLEGLTWAAAYWALGAAAGFREALYVSLGAMTTLGTPDAALLDPWRAMAPVEAASGQLLFGLSTALLFALMQRMWAVLSLAAQVPPLADLSDDVPDPTGQDGRARPGATGIAVPIVPASRRA